MSPAGAESARSEGPGGAQKASGGAYSTLRGSACRRGNSLMNGAREHATEQIVADGSGSFDGLGTGDPGSTGAGVD